jgi:predicted dehydrogenase
MTDLTRRTFLAQTAAATLASTASAAAASDKLTIGLIGPGGMGSNHLENLIRRKDIRFAYVCDVDANRLAAAAKRVDTSGLGPVKAVKDMRTIFDDKSVDAVWIATPDHWHCPASLLAVEAGKHVYVEKPVSHNIREGRLLLDAARKHNKVVQVGTQSRSTGHVARAIFAAASATCRRPARRTISTSTCGWVPRRSANTTPICSPAAGAGSLTLAPATLATTASTTSTSPAGDWE